MFVADELGEYATDGEHECKAVAGQHVEIDEDLECRESRIA